MSYMNIGLIYANQGNYAQALENLFKSLSISKEIGALDITKDNYEGLSDVYEKMKQPEKALEYYKLYTEVKDSIFNADKSKELGRLEGRYETEKKIEEQKRQEEEQARIEKANRQHKNQVQYFAILIGIVLFFIGLFFLGRFIISMRLSEGLVFFVMLLLFEFILVYLDPKIDYYSAGEPLYKLGTNAVLALLIFPVHSFIEERLKKRIKKTMKMKLSEKITN